MSDVISGIIGLLVILAIIAGFMYGLPTYNVWRSEMAGKAELRQAEWNRQIQIKEAEAKLESASLLADSEVERARGISQANEIIADGLGGAEGYLRYLYIDMLSNKEDRQIIYIPTEASLPVLEAGLR